MDTPLFILAIIAGGLAVGAVARFLVPGHQPLSLSETAIVGMVGSAIGGAGYNLVFTEGDVDRIDLGSLIAAVIGSVIILAIITLLAERFGWRHAPPPSLPELIVRGESAEVEFKSTARWNIHTRTRDDGIELAIAKTVAGFLNADGGTLVIGVDDGGNPLGLDDDLALMKQPDHDRYELWLTDHLQRTLGKPAIAFITVEFADYRGKPVVGIRIEPSDRPVFLDEPKGGRTADFYVRMGNSTRKLLTDEFAEYRSSRWK